MRKVLLVTDASWVANDVRAALAVDNWDIAELSDPKLTAEVAEHIEPEAIVIDMQVQSMGGMAIIRSVRAAFQATHPPRMVLLLDRSADRFLARRALADAAVLKPINADELRSALGRTDLSSVGATDSARTRKKAPKKY